MSMKRCPRDHQGTLWIAHNAIAKSPGHPFAGDVRFLVMELIDGEDLYERLTALSTHLQPFPVE